MKLRCGGPETMRDITIGEDEWIVNFDVSSLFTNVPIGEAVQVIQAKLREDDNLAERTPLLPGRDTGHVPEIYLLQILW